MFYVSSIVLLTFLSKKTAISITAAHFALMIHQEAFGRPSVDPFSYWSQVMAVTRSAANRLSRPPCLPGEHFPSLPRDPEGCSVPRPDEIYDLCVLHLPRGLLLVECAQKTAKGRHRVGILIRCPNNINWLFFTWRSNASTASSLRLSENCCLSLRLTLQRAQISAACSHSLGHYPKLMTIGEGWGLHRLINWEFCIPVDFSVSPHRPHFCPSVVKKTTRYLNSFNWGKDSLPTQITGQTSLSSLPNNISAENECDFCFQKPNVDNSPFQLA